MRIFRAGFVALLIAGSVLLGAGVATAAPPCYPPVVSIQVNKNPVKRETPIVLSSTGGPWVPGTSVTFYWHNKDDTIAKRLNTGTTDGNGDIVGLKARTPTKMNSGDHKISAQGTGKGCLVKRRLTTIVQVIDGTGPVAVLLPPAVTATTSTMPYLVAAGGLLILGRVGMIMFRRRKVTV